MADRFLADASLSILNRRTQFHNFNRSAYTAFRSKNLLHSKIFVAEPPTNFSPGLIRRSIICAGVPAVSKSVEQNA